MSARLVVAEVVGEDAELLHGAARDALEAGAAVDVGDVDGAGLRALDAAVGDDGRTRARREEEEKAQRAAEREESRRQLLQIQEELRKQREEREALEKEKESKGGDDAAADTE